MHADVFVLSQKQTAELVMEVKKSREELKVRRSLDIACYITNHTRTSKLDQPFCPVELKVVLF